MHPTFDQAAITYSPLFRLDTRAGTSGPLTDPALLDRIKSQAIDPSVFDQYPPYTWRGEISSFRWDSYDTRMGASTLKNYAAEAEAGVAFLRNHNNAEDSIGYSLSGKFTNTSRTSPARVEADFYALTDPATEPYLAKIRAGVVRDLSVGFFGGEWICSLCGRDMQQWFGDESCPHLLGMTYTPTDEAGTVKGPPEVARATIENGHLAEVSGVYDGSTPGAMIGKARSLAADGHLNRRMTALVERRYRIYLPEPVRRIRGVTLPVPSPVAAKPTQGVRWNEPQQTATVPVLPAWACSLPHGG